MTFAMLGGDNNVFNSFKTVSQWIVGLLILLFISFVIYLWYSKKTLNCVLKTSDRYRCPL